MWPYLAEQCVYAWAYVQLVFAVYVRPFLKPKGVSKDTKEADNG